MVRLDPVRAAAVAPSGPSACPRGLPPNEVARLDAIICSTRLVRQGEALYRVDDPFQSTYAVRAGSFNNIVMHRDGQDQITRFHLAGDPSRG
jgi:CRP/FNR family transcriptional regulator